MQEEEKIKQEQFFDLITSQELSWQSIIYDLIKTEQLDPWDINLEVLAERYVQIIRELEEANFFISSKVLLACSLLLRLKSEILVSNYLQDLESALYGKKDETKSVLERLEINEDELPDLVPKTPMSRNRKVTLQELMKALGAAIETENRRIKREIKGRQAQKAIETVMPKNTHVPLKVRIKNIFNILTIHSESNKGHLSFSKLANEKQEKLASFVPILHLSNDMRVFLKQNDHFEEILLSLKPHPEEHKALEQELGLYVEE